MAQHARLKIDAGLQVYFCDPQSPWQRATNENTNGLLRRASQRDSPERTVRMRSPPLRRPQHTATQDTRMENAGRGT